MQPCSSRPLLGDSVKGESVRTSGTRGSGGGDGGSGGGGHNGGTGNIGGAGSAGDGPGNEAGGLPAALGAVSDLGLAADVCADVSLSTSALEHNHHVIRVGHHGMGLCERADDYLELSLPAFLALHIPRYTESIHEHICQSSTTRSWTCMHADASARPDGVLPLRRATPAAMPGHESWATQLWLAVLPSG